MEEPDDEESDPLEGELLEPLCDGELDDPAEDEGPVEDDGHQLEPEEELELEEELDEWLEGENELDTTISSLGVVPRGSLFFPENRGKQ